MKGYRFYLEYNSKQDKRKGKDQGNVLAFPIDSPWWVNGGYMHDCLSAVLFIPDSPVCWSSCSWEFLRENCKRISEKQARIIHHALFEYLDRPD